MRKKGKFQDVSDIGDIHASVVNSMIYVRNYYSHNFQFNTTPKIKKRFIKLYHITF